jgi:hypothetical protein
MGVFMPSGGEELTELAWVVGPRSGDKLPSSANSSGFAPGIGIGSDISKRVRL